MKNKNQISDKELMELYERDKYKGNEAAITQYGDYVYSIINKYYSTFYNEVNDLHQSGCVGILNALKKFDANKGTFYNYSFNFIKKELGKYILSLIGESSEYYASIHRKVTVAQNSIRMEGKKDSVEEIMNRTRLSKKIVTRELKVDYTKVSYEMIAESWHS